MILADLAWGAPAWVIPAIVLAAVAVLATVASYYRARAAFSVRAAAGLLKATGVTLLALCLLEPLLSGTRPKPGANIFVLLADDSRSLTVRDPGESESRGEALREMLKPESLWQTRLGQDFDVRRYAFAGRLRSVSGEAELSFESDHSALATALRTLADRYRRRPLAGILLFSDGVATDRLEPASLAEAGLPPVYPVVLGKVSERCDVAVQRVAVSQTNFEAAPITVQAEVTAQGAEGKQVRVELLAVDREANEIPPGATTGARAKLVEQQVVRFSEEDNSKLVRFQLRPEKSGVRFYRVRARLAEEHAVDSGVESWTEETTEATLANNERAVVVDRGAGPYRVLYVGGRPNWEFKFLRRALAEDPEVELVGLVRIAKREPKFDFRSRRGESTNPLFRGFGNEKDELAERYDQPVLLRLGTRDEEELRGGFPAAADQLFEYHALVFDDLEAEFFTRDQMTLVKDFVGRRGGGLLMLGGAESFRSGQYQGTPLAELLPVYLDRPPASNASPPYRLALSREGWISPWLRLRKTEEAEHARFEAMPDFKTLNRAGSIKPGATVLAHVLAPREGKLPALVAQRYGTGRAAALLIGDLWRWGLRRETVEPNDLARAWRQTVRWLIADVPDRVEVNARHHQTTGAAAVELEAAVRDSEFQPLDGATVELSITTPAGKQLELRAEASAMEAGRYAARYVPREPGGYRAKVQVVGPRGEKIGRREVGFVAAGAAEEFARLTPRRELLERLASATGGRVVPREDLAAFVRELRRRDVPVAETWFYPLWHTPWVFALAVACLCGEWGLRRVRGLP